LEIVIEIAFNHIRNIREYKVFKFDIVIKIAPALGIVAASFLKGD
jgi:hypothetical protein